MFPQKGKHSLALTLLFVIKINLVGNTVSA